MTERSPAVFLDRDGTLIEDVGYLDRLERLNVFPWSVDAVRLLNRAGFKIVIITNQAGVARGIIEESFVREAHVHLKQMFASGGARIDEFYYCPHHPDGSVEKYRHQCECRKPGVGMIRQAERELGLDLSRSYIVGDRWLDVGMARAVGASGILVLTGYGRTEAARQPPNIQPESVVANVIEAASWIIRHRTGSGPACS